jgi:hypothetical protein
MRRIRVAIVAVDCVCVLSVSVSLVIQDAHRMYRIVLSTVACLDTLSHKRNDFLGKKETVENKKSVLIFL